MKVALVDIDGCILQNGALNQALIAKLKAGGYDQIQLFTQRNAYVQMQNIKALAYAGDGLITTPQVVEALQQALQRPVLVSTSVDQFWPGDNYYQEGMKDFEGEFLDLCQGYVAKGDPIPSQAAASFIEQTNAQAATIRAHINEPDASKSLGQLTPEGKVEHYRHLAHQMNLSAGDQVEYFDDSLPNLDEFIAADFKDIPVPHLQWVKGTKIDAVSHFDHQGLHPQDRGELHKVQLHAKARDYMRRGMCHDIETAKVMTVYRKFYADVMEQRASPSCPPSEKPQLKTLSDDLARVNAFLMGREMSEQLMSDIRKFAVLQQDEGLLKIAYQKNYSPVQASLLAQVTIAQDREIQKDEPNPEILRVLQQISSAIKSGQAPASGTVLCLWRSFAALRMTQWGASSYLSAFKLGIQWNVS